MRRLASLLLFLGFTTGMFSYGLPVKNEINPKLRETRIRLNQIHNALNLFYTDCGFFPRTLEGLWEDIDGCRQWGPQVYLRTPDGPLVDAWGNSFQYELSTAEAKNFSLKSLGADGREGGTGEDADLIEQ